TLTHQVTEEMQEIGRTLSGASFPLTDTVLHQIRSFSRFDFGWVPIDGRKVSTLPWNVDNVTGITPVHSWMDLAPRQFRTGDGQAYLCAALTLTSAERQVGTLYFVLDERHVSEVWPRIGLPALVGGGVGCVVVVGLIGVWSGRTVRRLEQLRRQTRAIAG